MSNSEDRSDKPPDSSPARLLLRLLALVGIQTVILFIAAGRPDWVTAIQRPTDGMEISKCILNWALEDRATGEAQPLPESLSAALRARGAVPG